MGGWGSTGYTRRDGRQKYGHDRSANEHRSLYRIDMEHVTPTTRRNTFDRGSSPSNKRIHYRQNDTTRYKAVRNSRALQTKKNNTKKRRKKWTRRRYKY